MESVLIAISLKPKKYFFVLNNNVNILHPEIQKSAK